RSRTDPFAGQSPDTARDYGRAPSDLSTEAPTSRTRALDGQQAGYRLSFVAMEVPDLPAVVKIGPVEVTQQAGPIWTQHTYIRQRPGWRPHYDKTMHQGYLQVGEGLQLTLAELPVVVPRSQHIQGALAQWRDQVLAAVSIFAALLDERVAQRGLLEDLIVSTRPVPAGGRLSTSEFAFVTSCPRSKSSRSSSSCLTSWQHSTCLTSEPSLALAAGTYERCSQVRRRRPSCSSGSRWRRWPRPRARGTPEPMCAVLRTH